VALRVTNQMIAAQTLRNLKSSLTRLDRYNYQLSTGKRINLPEDDPAGTAISMRLRTNVLETEQYLQNVAEGIAWLEATDSALDQATQVLQRARTLVVYAGNDALAEDSRTAISMELAQLIEDLVQIGNLQHGDRYLFGGENTLTEPFVAEYAADGKKILSVTYRGTVGDYSVYSDPDVADSLGLVQEIGPGIKVRISTHGDVALLPAVQALIRARESVDAGDVERLSTEVIKAIDDALGALLSSRAEVGARTNRLEHVRSRLEHTHTNLLQLVSNREDADMVEVIMNLKLEETVYQLALASGARVLQPTLMDFLR